MYFDFDELVRILLRNVFEVDEILLERLKCTLERTDLSSNMRTL